MGSSLSCYCRFRARASGGERFRRETSYPGSPTLSWWTVKSRPSLRSLCVSGDDTHKLIKDMAGLTSKRQAECMLPESAASRPALKITQEAKRNSQAFHHRYTLLEAALTSQKSSRRCPLAPVKTAGGTKRPR